MGNSRPAETVLTSEKKTVLTFLLWIVLFVVSWPLALLALVLYPIVWVLLLPFRLVGVVVTGVFELLTAIITLPAKAIRALAPG